MFVKYIEAFQEDDAEAEGTVMYISLVSQNLSRTARCILQSFFKNELSYDEKEIKPRIRKKKKKQFKKNGTWKDFQSLKVTKKPFACSATEESIRHSNNWNDYEEFQGLKSRPKKFKVKNCIKKSTL